jgi:uncharacterized repeat protein (TIGR01451 family)
MHEEPGSGIDWFHAFRPRQGATLAGLDSSAGSFARMAHSGSTTGSRLAVAILVALVLAAIQPYSAHAILRIDVFIDGNGQDVYGARGTGAGGQSVHSVYAPGTIDFIVEIENEGVPSSACRVSWQSIPGWTATFAGSPSPYTTDAIPPPKIFAYTFRVVVPEGMPPSTYRYVLDIVTLRDTTLVESVEARIVVLSEPVPDLVIDGDGLGLFDRLGLGAGGTSVRTANPGTSYTAMLDLCNAGQIADSFLVSWAPPLGWPEGSVVVSDGVIDHAGAFSSTVIAPGASLSYTVEVNVPAVASTRELNTFFRATSFTPGRIEDSARLVTDTFAVLTGIVFDDRDHNGAYTAGDLPLASVAVNETAAGMQSTAGDGSYRFLVTGGTSAYLIEQNPSGFFSLSADTVATPSIDAGDTVRIDFADVGPLALSAGAVLNTFPGGYVDFPHRIDALTKGQVTLTVSADPDIFPVYLLDANSNGTYDVGDRLLQPSDLLMDPDLRPASVFILLRVPVPVPAASGTTFLVRLDAEQAISGTPYTFTASTLDAVVVLAGPIGRVDLHKNVDVASAAPGDVLTYTVSLFNAGADSVQNIVIVDPVSPFVDPLPDAFGPGRDVEWLRPGIAPAYLTLDPVDGDACEYDETQRLMRLVLSRSAPYCLEPGASGSFTYRVRVK